MSGFTQAKGPSRANSAGRHLQRLEVCEVTNGFTQKINPSCVNSARRHLLVLPFSENTCLCISDVRDSSSVNSASVQLENF